MNFVLQPWGWSGYPAQLLMRARDVQLSRNFNDTDTDDYLRGTGHNFSRGEPARQSDTNTETNSDQRIRFESDQRSTVGLGTNVQIERDMRAQHAHISADTLQRMARQVSPGPGRV